jgi:hypothetical protein
VLEFPKQHTAKVFLVFDAEQGWRARDVLAAPVLDPKSSARFGRSAGSNPRAFSQLVVAIWGGLKVEPTRIKPSRKASGRRARSSPSTRRCRNLPRSASARP